MNVSDNTQFPKIKDVVLGDTIGQGTFGCVKNAHLKIDPKVIIAVKFIHIPTCKKNGLSDKDITKEVILHSKCSKHPNVLRLIDCNISNAYMWIVMEMADGGDLFDKIEPDIGVDSEVAQFYFQQLIRAISYLHDECGIAHRDIKPENILLDRNGNLKLADFGLASQFKRNDGTIRVASDQRGSPAYMAPEILYSKGGYYANSTDIWSIGILLFVLLTGEIPWELPVMEEKNFACFIQNNGNLNLGPWAKIDFSHLNLLRKMLQPDPKKRASLKILRTHPWFTKGVRFANSEGLCKDPAVLAKKLLSNLRISLSNETYERFTQDVSYSKQHFSAFSSTQPVASDLAQIEHDYMNVNALTNTQTAFTQYPFDNRAETLMSQEAKWTQFISHDFAALQFSDESNATKNTTPHLHFNPNRLTKFYTVESFETIFPVLEKSLYLAGIKVKPDLYGSFSELISELGYEKVVPLVINIKTHDRRGGTLVGSLAILNVDEDLKSIGFDRKSGDPLEWRRLFKKVALFCRDIILIPN
ncbi:serine/threonine protein kinase CHK1 NDAI_0B04700 [Naumovozyma dairenensis CBS 421]|uniref:non-specific serine/threonine protein kinase n=1 Tax=Naumovozyma dairenensis (strain ATCC 10597 / BCRC 20456 / CBS 421 / NBRC 0211 / NRRL Y-12639) TaxID=1071378 RepID=G0W6U4_NAUDC|nr:hypothetical protein NDAI_0B04700 [Naumovozyma dairenensis CBS 421]CCD23505.1 hypothetical protein NDAI_0B04700 [Naumovozyma dairenensis CBS 421]